MSWLQAVRRLVERHPLASDAAGLVWIGIDDFLFPVVVFGGAWFAGRLVRQREVYARVVEERSAALERERDANVRVAAAEERARIARELHDVLSHSVSVMVVQAGAERLALGSERAATGETLEAIENTGRQALAEMRRLLGMLRVGGEPPAHTPQPTLRELDELIAQVREAGLPLSFRWRASLLRFRPPSRSPPIASCRRPSPMCSNTPGRRG